MPAIVNVNQNLNTGGSGLADLASKTWSELDKAGKLDALKAADINLFKQKYKEQFGTEYTG